MTALLLLAGCADLQGVWYFEVTWRPLDDPPCTGSVVHDFAGAREPGEAGTTATGEDPWSSTVTETWSPASFFALLTEAGGRPVLVAFDQTWAGEQDEATGAWRFTWSYEDRVEQRDAHASGYAYEADVLDAREEGLVGTFERDAFEGAWEQVTTYEAAWTESDTWSEEVEAIVGTTGRIPAGDWLVLDDGTPAANTSTEVDCTEAPCALQVATTCSAAYEVVGWRTDLAVEDFDAVQGAGNDAGL